MGFRLFLLYRQAQVRVHKVDGSHRAPASPELPLATSSIPHDAKLVVTLQISEQFQINEARVPGDDENQNGSIETRR
jgi:hypothetical protein